jgi:hypothetical protein
MRLYLSRRLNGLYQLTRLEPIICDIIGLDQKDAFPQPGDPISFQGLCPIAVKMIFGRELDACQTVRVLLTCDELVGKGGPRPKSQGDNHARDHPG